MSINSSDAVRTAINKVFVPVTNLAPGVHHIDTTVTLRVQGVVKKGEDTTYIPTVDIPMLDTLALLLEKLGVVGPAAETMLVEAMTEALNNQKTSSQAIQDRLNDIAKAKAKVNSLLGQLPRKARAGRTTVDCSVVEVQQAQTPAVSVGLVG